MKIPAGLANLLRLLGNRNYGLYVFGHWAGNIGLWMQRLAIGWLTWELTHSFGWLGVMAVADQMPSIVFGIFAGAVVDRVDYMKVLRVTQICTFLHSALLAALTLHGAMDIWLLITLTFLRGILSAFNRPSRMTVVYVLVGREQLASALAFNSMVFNSSRFFGPGVGGAIMAFAGTGWTFAVAAASMALFSILLHIIRIGPLPPRERPTESIVSDAVAGVRYALSHVGIQRQLTILVLVALFARPVTDLFPGFVSHVFDRGPDSLALLLVCHSIGAMAGGVWLTSRSAGVSGLSKVMIVSILFMAVVLAAFSVTTVFWVGCVAAVLLGLCFNIQAISNQTLIQYAVDPALRGRVVSLYGLIARGGPAVGALVMGTAADHFGLPVPLGFGAALCLVLWLWAWRQRRTMAAALEGAPPAAPDVPGAPAAVTAERVP